MALHYWTVARRGYRNRPLIQRGDVNIRTGASVELQSSVTEDQGRSPGIAAGSPVFR